MLVGLHVRAQYGVFDSEVIFAEPTFTVHSGLSTSHACWKYPAVVQKMMTLKWGARHPSFPLPLPFLYPLKISDSPTAKYFLVNILVTEEAMPAH